MAERDEHGRFVKGSTGNPRGRLPKDREIKFYDLTSSSVTTDEWQKIVGKAKEQAMRGDPIARKWLGDYLIGQAVSRIENEKQNIAVLESAEPKPYEIPIHVIAPSFMDVYDDIHDHLHTEYLLFGGRGSTKSSFISLIFIWLIKNYPDMHLLAVRQVKDTLRDSVYAQIQWAINVLGFEDEFKCTTSPLEITYLSTGQHIYFRGADEPGKLKSIKPPFGAIGGLWIEELDQLHGAAAVRKIEQSAIRGTNVAYIFKSFNPPPTAANWANKYTKIPKSTQYQHFSTYLDLGKRVRWLGEVFVQEAEHLKNINPTAYNHEYLGVPSESGGTIFMNLNIRAIADDEIMGFDHIFYGLDWGFALDPLHWVKLHYDAKKETIYVFDEFRARSMGNRELYNHLVTKGMNPEHLLIADSAEPKSIADLREYGLTCRGSEKGPDSVRYSIRWLQNRAKIVVDNTRCPYLAQEMMDYEYEQDKDGEFISEYPDANNHGIDAIRYALNLVWKRRGQ
jgi:PBSX family phage terminase large subunit